MSNYRIEKILTDEERLDLLRLYDFLPKNLAHQDYNLFDVDKRSIPKEEWSFSPIEKLNDYVDSSLKPVGHYFVNYTEESFTRMHVDNEKVVALTIITMLERKDLIGGETLVFNTYEKKARPSYKYAKRVNNGPPPVGKDIIPVIVNVNDGESMIYNAKTKHAVTQVMQGSRIVLVSWFK